jgi:hypothetical protein
MTGIDKASKAHRNEGYKKLMWAKLIKKGAT